jgi:hypothetical protein
MNKHITNYMSGQGRFGIISFLFLIISGCGWADSSVSSINPSWFPEEFYYDTVGSCENGDLSFRMLSGAGTQLWTDPSAILTAQTDLYLRKDGTYTARYREFDFNNEVYSQMIESTFSLDNETEQIELAGLGVGKIRTSPRGRKSFQLQYSLDLHAPLLKNNTGDFILYRSIQGLNTDRSEHCGL